MGFIMTLFILKGRESKSKKKKMLPLVVHFTPQESLQVAGRTRNRRCAT